MSRARLYLGIVFAAPVTVLTGLFYLLPFWALGWYSYHGVETAPADKSPLGIGLVFTLNADKAPDFVNKYWRNWAGHCVGSTVVLKRAAQNGLITLNHELHHVHQMHTLGFLQPILYAASSFISYCAGEKLYNDNAFEVAARRAAGQVADPASFTQGYLHCKNDVKNTAVKL